MDLSTGGNTNSSPVDTNPSQVTSPSTDVESTPKRLDTDIQSFVGKVDAFRGEIVWYNMGHMLQGQFSVDCSPMFVSLESSFATQTQFFTGRRFIIYAQGKMVDRWVATEGKINM